MAVDGVSGQECSAEWTMSVVDEEEAETLNSSDKLNAKHLAPTQNTAKNY